MNQIDMVCIFRGAFIRIKKLRSSVISYKETYTVRPGYKPCVTLLFIALCLFWIFLGIFGALKKIFIQWAHENGAGESAEVPVQILLAKWLLWLGQNNESDRHLDYLLYAKCNTSGVTFVIPCDRNQSQFFLTLNSQVNCKYLSIKAFCHLPTPFSSHLVKRSMQGHQTEGVTGEATSWWRRGV